MTDQLDKLEAETRRLNARALGIALVTLLLVATTVLLLTVVIQSRQQRSLCRTTNALRTAIRESILRQKKNLPKISYFREHPDEMRDQKAEITQELASFADKPC